MTRVNPLLGVGSLTLALLATAANSSAAQKVEVIPSEVACPECTIVLDSVMVLDGRRSPHLGRPLAIGFMRDGRVLLTPDFDIAAVVVFDKHGRFLQTLGRTGDGPGEFRAIGQIKVGTGDTIRIYDHLNPRVSVFSPELELIETKGMTVPVGPGTNGLVELPDGRLVTQRPIPWDAHAGFPVHVLSPEGQILLSFGAETENPSYQLSQQALMWRTLAPESEDRLWIAPTTEYSIELWDLSGNMVRKLVRVPDWFPPHPGKAIGIGTDDPRDPPDPGIVGLWKDADGLLWVVILIPDDDWEEALGSVNGHWGSMVGPTDRLRYWDTMIEVLDPDKGRLIASERFDHYTGMMTAISPGGRVVSYREDEHGFPFVHVWKPRLYTKGR